MCNFYPTQKTVKLSGNMRPTYGNFVFLVYAGHTELLVYSYSLNAPLLFSPANDKTDNRYYNFHALQVNGHSRARSALNRSAAKSTWFGMRFLTRGRSRMRVTCAPSHSRARTTCTNIARPTVWQAHMYVKHVARALLLSTTTSCTKLRTRPPTRLRVSLSAVTSVIEVSDAVLVICRLYLFPEIVCCV